MAFLSFLLITAKYARHVLSKDTSMDAWFEEKHEVIMLMNFQGSTTRDIVN
jgi:hypothetical protein